jgi:hypothetical protein
MDLNIKEVSNIASLKVDRVQDVEVEKVHDIQVTHVKDVELEKIQKIAPVATHIKEINNIDPLTIDTFNVSEVRNIDPIRISQFDVTTIPPVNITLRQMPPVDLNIRKLPPLSIGLNQHFHIPSRYNVSASVLGFELLRISLEGESTILPRSGVHREEAHVDSRSVGETAAAGNPAIPFRHVLPPTPSNAWGSRPDGSFSITKEEH